MVTQRAPEYVVFGPGLECPSQDERFQRRTGLAPRAGRQWRPQREIHLARFPITPTHECTHEPRLGLDRHQRAVRVVLGVVEASVDHLLRVLLEFHVEARLNAKASGEDLIGRQAGDPGQVLPHVVLEVGVAPLDAGRGVDLDLLLPRRLDLLGGRQPVPEHLIEHALTPFLGNVGGAPRREEAGRRDRLNQQRRFTERDLARRLAEVGLRRRLHAEGRVAQVDGIEVAGEDLILRHRPLHLGGEDGLLGLAEERPLALLEVEVVDELLGDGGAALDDASGGEVVERAASKSTPSWAKKSWSSAATTASRIVSGI